ncbi:hypothetical protein GGS20DRAFT_566031 [Poronia punctata]|nr:hypothetical protein GGS20DRAFT_566031 [Poronia punctata]
MSGVNTSMVSSASGYNGTTTIAQITGLPTITETETETVTMVVYSACDTGYTGTHTVTITPRVTALVATTVTYQSPSASYLGYNDTVTTTDLLTGTLTVTVSPEEQSTRGETGAIGGTASSDMTTTSDSGHFLTTITRTVVPVPQTSPVATSTVSIEANSTSPFTFPRPPLTITVTLPTTSDMVTSGNVSYSVAGLPSSTTEGTTTTTTAVAGATTPSSVSVDTTCTEHYPSETEVSTSTSASASVTATMTMTILNTTQHTPYPVSTSQYYWSVVSSNGTFANMTGTATPAAVSVVYETVSSNIIVHPTTPGNGTFTSNASSDKKKRLWGENNGNNSNFCLVMLAAISFLVQVLMV